MAPTILESMALVLFPDSYGIDTVDSVVGSSASRLWHVPISATILVDIVILVATIKHLFGWICLLLRQGYQGSKGIIGATGCSPRILLLARPLHQDSRLEVGNVGIGDNQFGGGRGF
jgi:hypothetical protein